jgi:hypothetical protein
MSRILHLIMMLSLALLAAACDDNPAQPGGSHATLSGHVSMRDDSVVVSGATVALIAGIPYRVVAGPVTTGADGFYQFKNAPAGDWNLFVFADGRILADPAQGRVTITRASRITRDITMIPSDLWGGGNRFIVGRVTDQATGKPVAGAFVSSFLLSVWHDFAGVMIDAEDMTDADGRYRIAPVDLNLDPGGLRIVHPLGVSRDGYAPFYMMDVPLADTDTLYTLDITLVRAGSGGTLQGRIVDANGPVANLPVALDFVGIPFDSLFTPNVIKGRDDPRNVPLLGKAVRTDTEGRFEIKNLSPGTYFIDPAFLPDDGYVTGYDEAGIVELQGNEVIDTGDIGVLPALLPVSPANGAVVAGPRPTLRWQTVAGADGYELFTGAGHVLDFERNIIGANEYTFDADLAVGTPVRWIIRAYRTVPPYDETIAEFETIQTFTVGE